MTTTTQRIRQGIALRLALTEYERLALKRLMYRVIEGIENAKRIGGLDRLEPREAAAILVNERDAREFLRRLG
jgi:hypothetical protein